MIAPFPICVIHAGMKKTLETSMLSEDDEVPTSPAEVPAEDAPSEEPDAPSEAASSTLHTFSAASTCPGSNVSRGWRFVILITHIGA